MALTSDLGGLVRDCCSENDRHDPPSPLFIYYLDRDERVDPAPNPSAARPSGQLGPLGSCPGSGFRAHSPLEAYPEAGLGCWRAASGVNQTRGEARAAVGGCGDGSRPAHA